MITSPEHSIVISPVGTLDNELFETISIQINRIFRYKTEVIPLLQDVNFAFDPKRKQHHSTPILKKLEEVAPVQATKIIGITSVDLFIPILTHVYGEAQIGGTACIISTHRLSEGLSLAADKNSYYQRVAKEAVHELGHTFKLRHCKDSACIMHYCRSIKDVDRKSEQLCRYCKTLLDDEIKRLSDRLPLVDRRL
ncbi:MAG: archaemetzincin family Zn-dependent metalloprotease [Thermodesulfobacteriota bacterium]|nr:archaemetzincin family Zn-dependent metalloprotease [Thermodesulfobacteriota bacterium]